MKLFLFSFCITILAIAGMAIGAMLSGKELKGSCGGLGSIMGEDCSFCEHKDKCKRSPLNENA